MELLTILTIIILFEVTYITYRQSGTKLASKGEQPVYIDTSVLMDGRIVVAAQTGFSPPNLVVPTSVISELQLLADQADAEKRLRARRGLDAIQELQAMDGVRVTILNDGPAGDDGVDGRLVELALKNNGALCTIDFNLNKVATVKGIRVLNINELAGSIRMAFLPGESVHLQLNQKGQGAGQAVGYLADGTMVVVDKAADSIGQSVEVEFVRSLQTAAGRMMFAKLAKPVEQTRGASKGRSRMPEETTSKAEQTRGSSEENSRTVAKNKKPEAKEQTDKKETSPNGRRQAPSRRTKASSTANPQPNSTSRRRPASSRSKEDDLIRLVNDQ